MLYANCDCSNALLELNKQIEKYNQQRDIVWNMHHSLHTNNKSTKLQTKLKSNLYTFEIL
uniref:Uncharacterized protein n=1 Tax=Romanomermis culicivorax TaxID=13658 RepID=A0A915L1Q6_ROMCU